MKGNKQSPTHLSPMTLTGTRAATQINTQNYQVFNSQFAGPSYAVKYLGIVDGTMGILSRKMALHPNVVEQPQAASTIVQEPVFG